MTRSRKLTRRIRAHMAETGLPYTAARAAIVGSDVAPPRREERPVMREVIVLNVRDWEAISRHVPPEQLHDQPSNMLVLRERDGERGTVIFCGEFEGRAVARALDGEVPPKPMTHDLLVSAVDALGGAPSEARITGLEGTTFVGELDLRTTDGEVRTVTARPSDAIAVAVRAGCPILVADDLLLAPTTSPPNT